MLKWWADGKTNAMKWSKVIIWFDPMNIIFNFFFIRLYPFLLVSFCRLYCRDIVSSFLSFCFILRRWTHCVWIALQKQSYVFEWCEKSEERKKWRINLWKYISLILERCVDGGVALWFIRVICVVCMVDGNLFVLIATVHTRMRVYDVLQG